MGGGEGGGGGSETHLVPYIWHTEHFVRCQFYILKSLRGGKWINLYQIEKNITIIAFDKPISKIFLPNTRTENMVSFHLLSLTMKYRFEKFVAKFLC